MSKFKGSDDNGDYVVWETKSTGQWNKKYTSGPDKGVHKGYTPGKNKQFETGNERWWVTPEHLLGTSIHNVNKRGGPDSSSGGSNK